MDIVSYSLGAKANKRITELTNVLLTSSGLVVPSGTNAERPVLGIDDRVLRYNTDNAGLEEWNGSAWTNVSADITAVEIKGTDTETNILAMSGMVSGDLWIASDTLDGWVYNGSSWLNIGPLQGPQGIQGIQGIQGETGNGINSIVRTSGDGSAGTTDTYTITYTDATTDTFTVYNGTEVDHISKTSGTGAPGTTDTYTVWGDLGETINLGTFNVYNGANGTGTLASIVAGTGIVVDNTDPVNPIVNTAINLVDPGTNGVDGVDGLISSEDKFKLDGIEAGAQVNAADTVIAPSDVLPALDGSALTGLTKTQVGLSNVDNTSDLDKPISTAQQTALDSKLDSNNPSIAGSITEETSVVTSDIIRSTEGTILSKTGTANAVLTDGLLEGQSAIYRFIGYGITYTVTFPTIKWVGGSMPALTDDDFITFFKLNNELWGRYDGTGVQV